MPTELIINATLPETRIALLENNEIQELHIERDSERGIVGNIYKGKVIRVLPGMQAAFVDIGLEKAAFLYVDDIFFPDMKTPLETHPLPETVPGQVAQAPGQPASPDGAERPRGGRGRDRGRGRGRGDRRGGQAPEAQQPALPVGSPEAHAAAQAEYARQMLDREGGEQPTAAAQPPQAEGVLPQNPAQAPAPVAASSEPEAAQPQARAPESAAQAFEEEDEDDTVTESPAVYRPEPLIDAAAWAEDLSDENEEEGDEAQAAAPAEGAPEQAQATEATEARPVEAAPEAAAHAPAPEAQQPQAVQPVAKEPPVAPLALPVTQLPSGKGPQGKSVRPVGVDSDDDEDEEESEMPRRRKRREPVNIADIIKEGQEIVVQVAKDPIGTKGARLTCHVSLPGRYLVFMPTVDHIGVSRRIESEGERRRLKTTMGEIRPAKTGVIVRTASGKQTDRKLKQDLDYLVTTWNDIQRKFNKQRSPSVVYQDLTIVLRAIRDMFTDEVDKVVVDSKREHKAIMRFVTRFIPQVKDKVELYEGHMPIFDMYGIETEIAKALERKVWLKSGGYLVVDQAEALVAIDVNTGRYVGKKTLEETILKTNLEAVKEIAYQLRLRNCGGIIILDLIDMEKEANKEKVYKALEEALKKDRARPSILKISSLGLIEMTRKRTRDSMVRSLCEPCSHCEGKGFVKNKLTIAYDIMRDIEREIVMKENTGISIQCHPSVADVLLEDKRDVLEDLEHQFNKKLAVRGNGAYHVEQYELVAHREAKNMVWSSEERRQILRQRVQERTQAMAAESRRHAEVERQERRRQEDERRKEQEKIRAERRAQAEEQRRLAAEARRAAAEAARAAALAAAEEQVRAQLTTEGLTAESPEWNEKLTAGVAAIMAEFDAQAAAQASQARAEERGEDYEEEGEGAPGEGGDEDRHRRGGRRRRRGRRGRGSGRGRDGRAPEGADRPRAAGDSQGADRQARADRPGRDQSRRPHQRRPQPQQGAGSDMTAAGPGGETYSSVPAPREHLGPRELAGSAVGGSEPMEGDTSRDVPENAGAGRGDNRGQGGPEGDGQRRRRRRGRRGGRRRRRFGEGGAQAGAPGEGGGPSGGGGGGGSHHPAVVAAPSGGGGGGGSSGGGGGES